MQGADCSILNFNDIEIKTSKAVYIVLIESTSTILFSPFESHKYAHINH